jgi:hypothetical protein
MKKILLVIVILLSFLFLSCSGYTTTYTTLPEGATLNPDTGEFSWTPQAGQEGVYQITFTATDSGNLSDSVNMTITVHPKNTKSK